MKKIMISIVFFYLFVSTAEATTNFVVDRNSSSAEFLAVGKPSALKIRGTKGKPEGKLSIDGKNVEGDISVNLSDFETGIGTRDHHMKEKYLEIDKEDFKVSKLKMISVDLPADFLKAPQKHKTTFKGTLRLHGVEKEVSGDLDFFDSSAGLLTGAAKFAIVLTDFGITVPSFAGITVADKVDIEINFTGKLESL